MSEVPERRDVDRRDADRKLEGCRPLKTYVMRSKVLSEDNSVRGSARSTFPVPSPAVFESHI
jgi:hypothetical protein